MFFKVCKDISYPKKRLNPLFKIKFDCASGSGYSAESIKGYEEMILGAMRVGHGTSFVDVSIPYYGYKLKFLFGKN
ncbi:hypothetical protein BTM369_05500 [Helicobacter pylori]